MRRRAVSLMPFSTSTERCAGTTSMILLSVLRAASRRAVCSCFAATPVAALPPARSAFSSGCQFILHMGGPDAGRNLGAKEKHPSVMVIVKLSGDGRRLGCANLDALHQMAT